jgi:diguanylate cyclase (GGDEF)-like protein
MTDNLTGIANRRAFEFSLKQEMVQADRYGSVFTIAMLDLDHFKQVNDRFGHETGDRVLRRICDISAAHLRNADRFYRYGGEEFLILMPETGLDGAVHLAERIREAVAQENQEGVGIVTVSIGVTQFRPGEPRNSLINRVDTALYAAKSSGRNAVSVV